MKNMWDEHKPGFDLVALIVTCWLVLLTTPIVTWAMPMPYQVTVDTTPLAATQMQLAFDFIDGGLPSNTVTASAFTTNGSLGVSSVSGGVNGMLPGTVALTDTSFFNEYLQLITLGTSLSFVLDATTLGPDLGSAPDSFSFFLLDPSTGFPLATDDPTGAGALLTLDIGGSATGVLRIFSTLGGEAIVTAVPVIPMPVPEPGTLLLLGSGLMGFLIPWRRLRYGSGRRSLLTITTGALLLLSSSSLLYPFAAQAAQTDVSNKISVTRSGFVFNRVSNTFNSTATLTNISTIPVSTPLWLAVTITPSTVSLANASGVTPGGTPYINVPDADGTFFPGETPHNILLKFSNPSRVPFTVTTQVFGVPPSTTGGDLKVHLVRKGANGAIVGAPNIDIARHSLINGAVIEIKTTDSNGLADFGNIGSPRTTVSILGPNRTNSGSGTDIATATLLKVLTGNITLRLDQLFPVDDAIASTVNVSAGRRDILQTATQGLYPDNMGQFITPLRSGDIAHDGTVTLITQENSDGTLFGCGGLNDIPLPANGSALAINNSTGPTWLNITSNEPVEPHTVSVRHKDLDFDVGLDQSGATCANQFAGANRYAFTMVQTGDQTYTPSGFLLLATRTQKKLATILSYIPNTLNVTMPDLGVSDLVRTQSGNNVGGSLSFALSGVQAALADLTLVRMTWGGGTQSFAWHIYAAPNVTQIGLTSLGGGLGARGDVPYVGATMEVEPTELDNVADFDDYWSQVSQLQGDLRGVRMNATQAASSLNWLSISHPIYHVNVNHTSFASYGFGTVMGADGLNCGGRCSSGSFSAGTTYSLNAVANSGARFFGWGGDCASFGRATTATLLIDSLKECTATFGPDSSTNFSLSVSLAGWNGLIQSGDGRIKCGYDNSLNHYAQCAVSYASGSAVNLSATSASTTVPMTVNWTGDCSGTETSTTVIMDRTKGCSANLQPRL